MTDPSSPPSSDTKTSDFSGTKPRTAGSAAINAPGRFSSKSASLLGHGNDAGNWHRQPAGGTDRATAAVDELAAGDNAAATVLFTWM